MSREYIISAGGPLCERHELPGLFVFPRDICPGCLREALASLVEGIDAIDIEDGTPGLYEAAIAAARALLAGKPPESTHPDDLHDFAGKPPPTEKKQ